MPAISALVFVAALGAAVLLGVDWQRHQTELAEERFLVSRVETMIDAAYIHRGEFHTWPASTDALCDSTVDSAQCRRSFNPSIVAYPMALAVTSGDALRLSLGGVQNVELAQGVGRALAPQAVILPDPKTNPNAPEYNVRIDIPLPFRLSLLEATLLTDGSNAMNKPLLFATSAAVGEPCKGGALSVSADGALLRCARDFWAH